jgi:hypothetical protein
MLCQVVRTYQVILVQVSSGYVRLVRLRHRRSGYGGLIQVSSG